MGTKPLLPRFGQTRPLKMSARDEGLEMVEVGARGGGASGSDITEPEILTADNRSELRGLPAHRRLGEGGLVLSA